MTAITNDKYMQFVLDHYDEIQALNELVAYTKERLPHIVKDEIVEAILELRGSYFREQGLKVAHAKQDREVWWYDPTVYNKVGRGPYFGFWYKNMDWTFLEAIDLEYAAELFLFIDTEDLKGKAQEAYIAQWVEILRVDETKLREAGLLLWYEEDEIDYTNPVLVTYPLYKELRVETIKEREYFRQQIQEAAKTLTSTVLPILREARLS